MGKFAFLHVFWRKLRTIGKGEKVGRSGGPEMLKLYGARTGDSCIIRRREKGRTLVVKVLLVKVKRYRCTCLRRVSGDASVVTTTTTAAPTTALLRPAYVKSKCAMTSGHCIFL